MKRRNIDLYAALSVSVITFLVYLFSLQHDFVNWDDNLYVYENTHIRSFDLTFLRWAFFDFYASNWHPLTWISHALDYAVWGLNPLGHHLTNNILHALNTFVVVLLAVGLIEFGNRTRGVPPQSGSHDSPFTIHDLRFSLVAATITGLLFGLHPLHVESVAWISERKDLLCALFFLSSISCYLNHVRTREGGPPSGVRPISVYFTKWYAISLGFFVLALLSKPMAVSLPAVLLLLDWYPFKRVSSMKTFLNALTEKLPYVGFSLVSSVLTVMAQKAGGAISSMEFIPLQLRVLTAAKSLTAYLRKMIVPSDLSAYYPYTKDASLSSPEYLLAILIVAGLTAFSLFVARKQRLWLSIWGYYTLTLVPVLGLVQVGDQAMADRYTYLPSLGPFLAAGLAIAWVWQKLEAAKGPGFLLKSLCAGAVLCMTASLAYGTVRQIGVWKDSSTLWSYVIERGPAQSRVPYINLAAYYKKMRQFDKAIEVYDKLIALGPSAIAYYNRGVVFTEIGQRDKAIEDFNMAIAVNPSFSDTYYAMGRTFHKMGRLDKAIESYDRYISLNPGAFLAYNNRGLIYYELGQYDKALQDFDRSIEINDEFAWAYGNRGNLYISKGNKDLAISDYSRACQLGEPKGCDLLKIYSP